MFLFCVTVRKIAYTFKVRNNNEYFFLIGPTEISPIIILQEHTMEDAAQQHFQAYAPSPAK